ncbi:MAG TPA: CDP-alcohol phosphatidyltransferase family protein [Intrasporangium sp.]|nr:CDP-alcohol phosphatidyltransferase family protein [Intrasporangium sp.]
MRHVFPPGPLVGFLGALGLLTALHPAASGWVIGLACGAGLAALLSIGLARASRRHLLPADRVTLARAVLCCGVAALVGERLADASGPWEGTGVLVALTSVALVLDAVDGLVARRTGTSHPLGARFDMETDAFLILVLAVHAARDLGWWVLATGAARYLLLLVALAGRWAPWLRGQVPARRWRKLVAAYQGVALTIAAARFLPPPLPAALVAVGLALLAVSFLTEVRTLRRLFGPGTPGRDLVAACPDLPSAALDAGLSP